MGMMAGGDTTAIALHLCTFCAGPNMHALKPYHIRTCVCVRAFMSHTDRLRVVSLDVHVKSVNFGCVTGPQCGRDLYGSAAGSAARLCCAKYMCDLRFVSLFCFVWPRVSESDAKYVTVYSANTHTHFVCICSQRQHISRAREHRQTRRSHNRRQVKSRDWNRKSSRPDVVRNNYWITRADYVLFGIHVVRCWAGLHARPAACMHVCYLA